MDIVEHAPLEYAVNALRAARSAQDADYYHYVCESVGLLGVLVDPRDVLEIVPAILEDLGTLGGQAGFTDRDKVKRIRDALLLSLANIRALYRLQVDRYLLDVLDDPVLYREVSETVPAFKLPLFYSWAVEQLVFRWLTTYYTGFGDMFVSALDKGLGRKTAPAAVREVVSALLQWVTVTATAK